MELILHTGLNKTGSSAIQSHMCLNRSLLLQKGIWFIESKEDDKMLRGEISAGNGLELLRILHYLNEEKLIKYISILIEDAKELKAKIILISNEALIRLFSNIQVLELLDKIRSKTDIIKITCFTVLRNPYDHALSLFKHRAKKGEFSSYQFWLESNYETIPLFQKFVGHYMKFNFSWVFMEYSKDGDQFINSVYQKIFSFVPTDSYMKLNRRVNQSISLNTISLISLLTKIYPNIGYKFLELFKNELKEDPEYDELINQFNFHAFHYFKKYCDTVKKMADLVDNNDWFDFEIKLQPKIAMATKIKLTNGHITVLNEILTCSIKYTLLDKKHQLLNYIMKPKSNFNKTRYGGNMRI